MLRPEHLMIGRHSSGQIIVVVAGVVVVLLGMMSLSIDTAVMYHNWVRLQNAADAAALAGAHYLPLDPVTARTVAVDYAGRNGVPPGEVTSATVAADNLSITIRLDRTVPYYFGRVLGMTMAPISVAATAGVQPVRVAKRPLPIGIDCPDGQGCFQMGNPVVLKLKSDPQGPGNWSPLDFGPPGGGGDAFRDQIANGYDGRIAVGDSVNTETGFMTGPTDQGFNSRIQEGENHFGTNATAASHDPADPRAIMVPLADFADPQGKAQVRITGFAVLWIDHIDGNGDITATFIEDVKPENIADPNVPAGGALVPVLLR